MDEYTADVFANQDEPIPVIAAQAPNLDGSSSDADAAARKHKIKRSLSPSRQEDIAAGQAEKPESSSAGGGRLLFEQVFPSENLSGDTYSTASDPRSSKDVSRPAFSLPLMTNNFRRFNARIGIVFVFQNRLIRLFTWRTPTHTLSFLAVYTFICLDPYLLVVVPMAVALFYILIPAFTSRHPPPPTQNAIYSTRDYHQEYTGPALAPARTIKPASETSKDFFRNMRDLQNSMADFSNVHDLLVSTITPATNFSDETFSSQLFLYLTIMTTLSFITAHLLPWRFIFLVGGWSAIVSNHPTVQDWLVKMQKHAEAETTLALNDPTLKHQPYISGIPLPATPHAIQSAFTSFSEITHSTTPETREVEIFELQHRPLHSITSAAGSLAQAAEWQPHLFTPSPYDPLSPARIAGDRPRGSRFFEDVEPPDGWEWASKKWELDLEAGEWVNERLVVGVEYDVLNHDADADGADDPSPDPDASTSAPRVSHTRTISSTRRGSVNLDFGGWVWDLPPAPGSGANREDDLWLAYGDYDVPRLGGGGGGVGVRDDSSKKTKRDRNANRKKGSRDWEEATRVEAKGRTGEWRRRRWVRLVKRRVTT